MGFLEKLFGGPEQTLAAIERALKAGSADKADQLLMDLRSALKNDRTSAAILVKADLLEGELRCLQGKLELGANAWRRVYQAFEERGDLQQVREAGLRLFQCLSAIDRHEEILERHHRIREVYAASAVGEGCLPAAEVEMIIGAAFWGRGHQKEAIDAYHQAITLLELAPKTENTTDKLIHAYSGLGDAHLAVDNRTAAIDDWRRALALTRELYGHSHPQVGEILGGIGSVLMECDDFEGARRAFEESLRVFEAATDPHSVSAGVALNNLAFTLMMQGDLPKAEKVAVEAVRVGELCSSRLKIEAQGTLQKIRFTSTLR